MDKRVYLDHAATTALRPEALEAMQPYLTSAFGNAGTLYREGKEARQALEEARATIANVIGAHPPEIVFTSGGTEANNAIIAGIVRGLHHTRGREKSGKHVISSAFEHHAVLEPLNALKRHGYEVTLARPRRDGRLHVEALAEKIREDTIFVSIMTVQNELGTVQPITELAQVTHEDNAFFHTDAVQALGKIPFRVMQLGVDAASFSAHKVGGPAGVGAFYLRQQTPFRPSLLGGGQEGGRRSGTQNVAGAVGFAKAVELADKERKETAQQTADLRDRIAKGLLAADSRITLTVPLDSSDPATSKQVPGIVSFLVKGFESETLILKLDEAGFAVSGGSACSTGSLDPSHVLMSIGLTRDEAYSALRVSLGSENTKDEADAFIRAFGEIAKAVR